MEWIAFALVLAAVVVVVLLVLIALFRSSRAPVRRLEPQDCPRCGTRMDTGTLEIKGTMLGLFVIGLSYQNLWFRPDSGGDALVLRSREPRGGWRCPGCGTVIVPVEAG